MITINLFALLKVGNNYIYGEKSNLQQKFFKDIRDINNDFGKAIIDERSVLLQEKPTGELIEVHHNPRTGAISFIPLTPEEERNVQEVRLKIGNPETLKKVKARDGNKKIALWNRINFLPTFTCQQKGNTKLGFTKQL